MTTLPPTTTTANSTFEPLHGQCTCGNLTYTLLAPPMITHCCHCTWCQRESGTVFNINAMIESFNFRVNPTPSSPVTPLLTHTPSPSGAGHTIARCPSCLTALYSYYAGFSTNMTFVKAGTLSDGSRQRVRPDIHIHTASKIKWVDLSKEVENGIPVFEGVYDREKVWGQEALERRRILVERIEEEKTGRGEKGAEG